MLEKKKKGEKLTGQGHKATEEEPLHGEIQEWDGTSQIVPLYTLLWFEWENKHMGPCGQTTA